jgi:2-polyprenyl-3-methyl-5-hydroxy-6-metoxy-1,4-benzoquinol methylase
MKRFSKMPSEANSRLNAGPDVDGRAARHASCSYCGSQEATPVFSRHGFSYARCNTCALVRVDPQLTQQSIDAIYRATYAGKSRVVARPGRALPGDLVILRTLERLCGSTGRLLEVGCFEGRLLWAARERGWSVTGTEISEAAVSYASREQQLDVRVGRLEDVAFPADEFDAVVLVDVIEHLPDPRRTLEEIHRILRPGGVLYLWTPNFDSLSRRMAGKRWGAVIFPWHLYYFTARTLTQMLTATGFVTAELTTRNWLLDFRDRYASLQAGGSLGHPPKLVRRARRLIDIGTEPLFAWMDGRGWHVGAQIEIYACKERN